MQSTHARDLERGRVAEREDLTGRVEDNEVLSSAVDELDVRRMCPSFSVSSFATRISGDSVASLQNQNVAYRLLARSVVVSQSVPVGRTLAIKGMAWRISMETTVERGRTSTIECHVGTADDEHRAIPRSAPSEFDVTLACQRYAE
jgi:hypothetical protein